MSKSVSLRKNLWQGIIGLMLMFGPAGAAHAQTFDKAFTPSSIGPGNVSTAVFTITNGTAAPLTGLSFSDTLPASVVIATPGNLSSTCTNPAISATDGLTDIDMTAGDVPAFGSCTVSVDVTSAVAGTHTNPAVTLSYDGGSVMSAATDLTVATTLPSFSKSFSSASVPVGTRVTLTFDIDNTANAAAVVSLDFTDNLPGGMVVADPANASTDCLSTAPNTTLTAVPGVGVVTLDANGFSFGGFEVLQAGATCGVSVDVVAVGAGALSNSVELLTFNGSTTTSAGKANDLLNATISDLGLTKTFTNDPVAPGTTATLRFDILNINRFNAATAVAFSDDLGAMLTGTTVSSVDSDTCNGTPDTSVPGEFSYSGGSLVADGGSCEIVISLAIPAGAVEGAYPNTTSTISASSGIFDAASDTLFVQAAPVISKTFTNDPVVPGDTVTLEFTITNPSPTLAATAVSFVDELSAIFGTPLAPLLVLPPVPDPPCGAGSTAQWAFIGTGREGVSLTNGSLAAGASCTFSVGITVPIGLPSGIYTNTTDPVTATIGGTTRTGNQATDNLVVIGAPSISKSFTNDPVAPGGNVTLEFNLYHSSSAPGPASNIAFSDDLGAMLAGTTITGVLADTCGGTPDTGTPGVFAYTGGALGVGASCSVSIDVAVPLAATPNTYTNTAGALTADVDDGGGGSVMVTGVQATDNLLVTGLVFSKQFQTNPVLLGDTVVLTFTLDNTAAPVGQDATGITFTDNLAAILPGTPDILATVIPPTPCGGSLAGPTLLIFTGGSVPAGTSCSFDVTLQVPVGAATGTHGNTTSVLSATVGAGSLVLPPATDLITVRDDFISLTKTFTDDPVSAGGTAALELTLSLDAAVPESVQGIAFTDDLNAMLTGATFTGIGNDCGIMLVGEGTGMLDANGITLAPGASCTILVSVSIPGSTPSGAYANTTSTLSGTTTPGGLAVTGIAAGDTLIVTSTNVNLTKSFSGFGVPGGTVGLSFTMNNLDTGAGVSSLSFNDDVNAMLAGTTVSSVNTNTCGGSASGIGTGLFAYANGSLGTGPVGCDISVTLQLPAAPTPGTVLNTTSNLFVSGAAANAPATALLYIPPPPLFAKVFAPNPIAQGGVSTLTFTIDNSAATEIATNLAFGDTFPAGMVVSPTPNGASTCGGSVTALAGAGSMSFSGGSAGVGAGCQVSVDVTTATAGSRLNTSTALTSLFGNSGTASDTLVTNPPPGFSKAFAPNPIVVGGVSTLTFTIDNSGATVAATALDFNDPFPANLVVAATPNAATSCTGGSITANPGAGTAGYTGGSVAAGATCTLSVDVTSAFAGDYANTSGALTSSLGSSGTAAASLRVNGPPGFAKAFAPANVAPGAPSTLTFTIDNTAGTVAATNLDFTDNFPANLVVATPPGASTTCTGGTLTAGAGTGTITYTGGTVAAAGTCTVQVDVNSALPGSYNNTSGALTSSLGNSGTTNAVLNVTNSPLVFSKAFAPATVDPGQVSTLTFTLDNSAGLAQGDTLDFTDNLPTGMEVAATPNASTTCTGGTVTAAAGAGVVSYTGGAVAAGATCTVQADVIGTLAGALVNTSGNLTSTLGNSGAANATLTVNTAPLLFSKAFAPTTVNVGAVSTLTFTLDNSAVAVSATNLDFTDTLPAGMQVAPTPNASSTCIGNLNITPGEISYTNGSLGAGATCNIQVDVTSSAGGAVSTNVSGNLTSSLGDSGTASAALTVNPPYLFVKQFGPATVQVGEISRLDFFIYDNGSGLSSTNLAFTDNLPAGMVVASAPNVSNTCGGTLTANPGGATVTLSGGGLGVGANCGISVDVRATASGVLLNITGNLDSSLGSSGTASASLNVNVASGLTIPTDGGGDSTVTVSGGSPTCGFTRAQWIPLTGAPNSPPAGSAPPDRAFPFGLFDFIIGGGGCTPGGTYTIEITLPTPVDTNAEYWKYGPTPTDPTPHWYLMPAQFSGNVVTLVITDGGLGDDDLSANGEIIDQGGPTIPALLAAAIPTLSEGVRWLMAGLMMLLGMALIARRRRRYY